MYLIFPIRFPDYSELSAGSEAPDFTNGLDEFVARVWNDYVATEEYSYFKVCSNYYKNKNEAINCKKRTSYERTESGGIEQVESNVLSNHKISHAYYKKIINQKVGFNLNKFPTFKPRNRGDERFDQMMEVVKPYLTNNLHRTIKNSAKSSISKGIDWVYSYWDEDNELKFARIPPEQVCPIWANEEETVLDGLIHSYTITDYQSDGKKVIRHYDYYHKDFVARYTQEEGSDIKPYNYPNGVNFTPYFVNDTGANSLDDNYSVMFDESIPRFSNSPWICFRYDNDFTPMLTRVKTIIDEIDRATSEIADYISDTPNAILMVRNYDGNEIDELAHNLNRSRILMVQGDGDAKALNIDLDITGTLNYLNHLNSVMYEVVSGIDSSSKDTRDTSGTALNLLYRDLATEVKEWEIELRESIYQIMYFILFDIKMKTGEDYYDVGYDIEFNYDAVVNETELIQNGLTSVGWVSNKTILENNPWVTDVDYEMKQIDIEKRAEMDRDLEYEKEASTFGTDTYTEVITTDNISGVRGSDES